MSDIIRMKSSDPEIRGWIICPCIDEFGNKLWYADNADILHREGGPAVEYIDGGREWWINGKLHREDGPALEYNNGDKFWWHNGKLVDCGTQEEFERLIKLELFW